jgi:hypothetical protein
MLKLHLGSGPRANEQLDVTGERWVVGRDPGADLQLEDEEVSREHAALRVLPDGRLAIEDLGSSNGTWVNGHRLTGPVSLSGGEQIRIGTTNMTVMEAGTGPTKIAPPPPAPAPPVPPPPVATPPPPQRAPAPRPAAPSPAARAVAAPPRKKGRAGSIIAMVVSLIVLLLVAGAVVFVITSGGTSEALFRLGIGGGWSDSEKEQFNTGFAQSMATPEEGECVLDELQKRMTFDEFEEFSTSLQSGTKPEQADLVIEAVNECGGDAPPDAFG